MAIALRGHGSIPSFQAGRRVALLACPSSVRGGEWPALLGKPGTVRSMVMCPRGVSLPSFQIGPQPLGGRVEVVGGREHAVKTHGPRTSS